MSLNEELVGRDELSHIVVEVGGGGFLPGLAEEQDAAEAVVGYLRYIVESDAS